MFFKIICFNWKSIEFRLGVPRGVEILSICLRPKLLYPITPEKRDGSGVGKVRIYIDGSKKQIDWSWSFLKRLKYQDIYYSRQA